MNVDKVKTLCYRDCDNETLLKMKEDYLRYKQLFQSRISVNESKKIIKKATKKKAKK